MWSSFRSGTRRRTGHRVLRGRALSSVAIVLGGLLASPWAVGAQASEATRQLVGQVVDSMSRRPIPGARVEAIDLGHATVTDSAGRFVLTVPAQDPFRIQLEQLGFRTRIVNVAGASPEPPWVLTMTPDPRIIQGLDIVVAEQGLRRVVREQERRQRAYTGSVLVIPRERLARSAAASTRDELKSYIPGARDCGIDAIGNLCVGSRRERPIKVCIDDVRAAGGAADLRAYDPHEVYSVEVYDRGSLVLVYTIRDMERAMTHSVWTQPFPGLVC